jgi:hypothetical protein
VGTVGVLPKAAHWLSLVKPVRDQDGNSAKDKNGEQKESECNPWVNSEVIGPVLTTRQGRVVFVVGRNNGYSSLPCFYWFSWSWGTVTTVEAEPKLPAFSFALTVIV